MKTLCFNNCSIQQKLVIIVFTAILISLIAAIAIVSINTTKTFKEENASRIEHITKVIAGFSIAPLTFRDREGLLESLEYLNTFPEVIGTTIFDANGKLFAQHGQPLSKELATIPISDLPTGYGEDSYNVSTEISLKGNKLGSIYLRSSSQDLTEKIHSFAITMGLSALGALCILLPFLMLLQRVISKPILSLAEAALRISEHKDFTVRVEASSNDEIGNLYDAFNKMFEMIEIRESERNAAIKALQVSEERYALAVDGSSDGIWDWNIITDKVFYSARHKELLGVPESKVEEDVDFFRSRLHPDDIKRTWDRVQLHLDAKVPYDIEYRLRHEDGSYRWFRARGRALWDENGIPFRMAGAITDITERHLAAERIQNLNQELEQRVNKRTAELEHANKELEAFSYSVSHDLRAPIRHISSFSELLRQDTESHLSESGLRFMEIITQTSQRMGELIDDLLTFSRLGRQAVSRQIVDCQKLVSEIWREVNQLNSYQNCKIEIDKLPSTHADPKLLRHVWLNLIENAAKYSSHNTAPLIQISSAQHDGLTWYSIKDNGVGFDQTYASKLFDPFQRLHREDEFPGTGIGLAITKRIVYKHGGMIRGTGKINEGAIFEFTLGNENDTQH